MSFRRKILKNTALQMTLNFFDLAAGLYSLSLIARYLGVKAFGSYSFVYTFYSFFLAFLDLGISSIVTREISMARQRADSLLSGFLTLKLFMSSFLTLIAVLIVYTYHFHQPLKGALYLYSLVLSFVALESVQVIFQVDLEYEYLVLASFLWRVSQIIVVLLSIWLNLGLLGIVGSFVAAELVKTIVFFKYSASAVKIKLPYIKIKLWRSLIKSSLPLAVIGICVVIMRRVDVVILAKIRGFTEVGIYNIAFRLYDLSLCLPIALMGSIFPLMSKFYHSDFNTLKIIYQKAFDALILVAAFIVVLVLALADKIIPLFFGHAYLGSALLLKILIFSSFISYITITASNLLLVADKQKANMWLCLLGALLNVALNIALIPRLGTAGAAISNLTVAIFVSAVTFYIVISQVNIYILLTKARGVIISALLTLLFLMCLKNINIFISSSLAVILYAVLIIITKAVDKEEIEFFLKSLRAPDNSVFNA